MVVSSGVEWEFFFFLLLLSEWCLKMFNNPIGVGKSNRTVGKVSVFIAVWRRKREGEVRSLCSTFMDPTKLITKPFNSSQGLLFTYSSLKLHFASFFPPPLMLKSIKSGLSLFKNKNEMSRLRMRQQWAQTCRQQCIIDSGTSTGPTVADVFLPSVSLRDARE